MHKLGVAALYLYRLFYSLALLILWIVVFRVTGARLGIVGTLLFFLLAYLLCVLVHEAGHVLAAQAAGWRLILVAIGCLLFVRQGRRFHLRLFRGFIPGGFTYAIPRNVRNLQNQLFWGILGGPLLGIFFGLMCFALMLTTLPDGIPVSLTNIPPQDHILWSGFLSCCILSLFISINSLIPGDDFLGSSDGQKLIQILAQSVQGQALMGMYALEGAEQNGARPRDWPENLLANLLEPELPAGLRIHGLLKNYYADLDRKDMQKAGSSLDLALLLGRGKSFPTACLYQEAAFFTSFYRGQPDLARKWLALIRPGLFDFSTAYARAQAAIYQAEGAGNQAMTWVEKGFLSLENSYEVGKARAERDWLSDISSQIQE